MNIVKISTLIFSAKYGSYSLMDVNQGKIVTFSLQQVCCSQIELFHLDLSCLHIDYNLIGQLPKAVDDVTACYNGYQVQLSLNAKILDNLKIVAVVSASPYSSHGDFYILDKR